MGMAGQFSTCATQTASWDEFKTTYVPRFTWSFLGLVAVRIWIQCCLYDRYTATDSGVLSIIGNLVRVVLIAVLIAYALHRSFPKRFQTVLSWLSVTAMTGSAILFLLQPSLPNAPLSLIACVLAGSGIVWGGGMWICFFVRLEPGEALIYTFANLGISSLLGLAVAQCDPTLAYTIAIFMPTLSLSAYWFAQRTLDDRRSVIPEPTTDAQYDNEPRRTLVWLFAGVCCLEFALGVARGFPDGSSISLSLPYQVAHQVGVFAICALLIVRTLMNGRGLRFAFLWRWQIALMVAGVICIATLGGAFTESGATLITIANTMMVGVLWFVAYDFARHSSLPPYVILGVVWIAHILPRELGRWLIFAVGPHTLFTQIAMAGMVCLIAISMAFVLRDSLSRTRPFFAELAGTQRSRTYLQKMRSGIESEGGAIETIASTTVADALGAKQSEANPPEAAVPSNIETEEALLDRRCASLKKQYGLTDRETDMVRFISQGRTRSYISHTLFISENTVKSYWRNVYQKLDIHSKQELLDIMQTL